MLYEVRRFFYAVGFREDLHRWMKKRYESVVGLAQRMSGAPCTVCKTSRQRRTKSQCATACIDSVYGEMHSSSSFVLSMLLRSFTAPGTAADHVCWRVSSAKILRLVAQFGCADAVSAPDFGCASVWGATMPRPTDLRSRDRLTAQSGGLQSGGLQCLAPPI